MRQAVLGAQDHTTERADHVDGMPEDPHSKHWRHIDSSGEVFWEGCRQEWGCRVEGRGRKEERRGRAKRAVSTVDEVT